MRQGLLLCGRALLLDLGLARCCSSKALLPGALLGGGALLRLLLRQGLLLCGRALLLELSLTLLLLQWLLAGPFLGGGALLRVLLRRVTAKVVC